MKFFQISFAALSLGFAAIFFSQPLHAAPEGKFREEALQKIKALREDLALTADQKGKVKAIVKSHKTPIKAQWSKGKTAREALRKASSDHGPESPEAKAAAAKVGDVARDRALLMAKIAHEVRPILTPEQLRKFEKARFEFQSLIETKLDSDR